MRCWIKRSNENGEFNSYFSKHLGYAINLNHWVQDRKEAMEFNDGRKARGTISKYKLRNCEIEYQKG